MTIRTIAPSDRFARRELEVFLKNQGLSLDPGLQYSCGLYDEEEELIATGSILGNTLRCLAVDPKYRGEGLMVQVVSHLMTVQAMGGNLHVFLYTKLENRALFEDLGFYEIARTDRAVFMENIRDGFPRYCAALERGRGASAAVVMNANPFTLGHRHLVERAAAENDTVHLFLLSENNGPIPFAVRRKLVAEGVRDLPNVILHETGSYMISSATFPSYFLPDSDAAIQAQAELDLEVFHRIAKELGITRRYVGQESASRVTGLYNRVMKQRLPELGLECLEIPRLEAGGRIISASTVRQAIHDDRLEEVRELLPESTCRFFESEEGAAVVAAIRRERDVIHY